MVEGCISSLVNMLLASHSIMQNEAILALTLLAIECLRNSPHSPGELPSPDPHSPGEGPGEPDFDYEQSYTAQLVKSEIGKHIAVLVDTNLAKMPLEVAENLLAFLDITSKKPATAADYRQARVHEPLAKFAASRTDLSPDMQACVGGVIKLISDGD